MTKANMKKWHRSKRNQIIVLAITLFGILYYISFNYSALREENLDITRSLVNASVLSDTTIARRVEKILDLKSRYIETKLEEALKEDKGSGCEFPHLDPFSKEVTQFDKPPKSLHCDGRNWVRCYLSECRVEKDILESTENIECQYWDIIYVSDSKYTIGSPTTVLGGDVYVLLRSDHVKVKCTGKPSDKVLPTKWSGHAIGFRENVQRKIPPRGREGSVDVLIFGFDSTSKNGFIRKMPKSYEYLTKDLGAVILEGYNIVGDGTPAALFPILTGRTELEWPDVRRATSKTATLDDNTFIFNRLKEDGYRTAYFEDMPWIGTFQYRFNGFRHQPADHYLRAFYLEEYNRKKKWSKVQDGCVGDTPNFKLMMNITEQFLKLDGKHFAFTFIADITHDDFNTITIADDQTRMFLRSLKDEGILDRTLLLVMGDHGSRFANIRDTQQGKFEERMPLMAIRLPEVLKRRRPEVAAILRNNSEVLTTPHDIYATLLDAMDLKQYYNDYKIRGADLTRGLSIFEPIPRSRSCSEAGIEQHWCACVAWDALPHTDPVHQRAAEGFLHYINTLTESVRSKCSVRTLTSIQWVSRRRANTKMLAFQHNRDVDGYIGTFNNNYNTNNEYYQLKVAVGPGYGVYEASAVYLKNEHTFVFDTRDISRTNAYNDEPSCISATHPHLNMYCYCNDYT